jgi:hypothetical protein
VFLDWLRQTLKDREEEGKRAVQPGERPSLRSKGSDSLPAELHRAARFQRLHVDSLKTFATLLH